MMGSPYLFCSSENSNEILDSRERSSSLSVVNESELKVNLFFRGKLMLKETFPPRIAVEMILKVHLSPLTWLSL